MTRIWSGRLQDQVYAGMAERLVRQSNNARLSPNVGVNPRVRRILARMHRTGLLENMAGLWLPDMYTADGENRIEHIGGVTAAGSLSQTPVANQPHLTRADEQMNLALQSVWPGNGSSPTGWSLLSGSGSLVAGTDGHQNYTTASNGALAQSKPVLTGQRYLLAVRAEVADSGQTSVVSVSGVSTSPLASFRNMAEASAGEWLWFAFNVNAAGNASLDIVIGENDEVSRPMLAYLPPDLDLENNAEVQAWLTDHYAATTNLRQYAGLNGMRGLHHSGTQHLDSSFSPLAPNLTSFSMFLLMNPHDGTGDFLRLFRWNANNYGFFRRTQGNYGFRIGGIGARQLVGGSIEVNKWILLSGDVTLNGPFRFYVNGSLVDEGTAGGSFEADNSEVLSLGSNSANQTITFGASGFSLAAFIPDQHAALNEILTEES